MSRPRASERRLIEPHFDETIVGRDRHVLYLHERVRNFRHLHHFSQADAAEWYGVSVREWQRYESGWDTPPPRPLLKRIVAYVRRACPEYIRYVS